MLAATRSVSFSTSATGTVTSRACLHPSINTISPILDASAPSRLRQLFPSRESNRAVQMDNLAMGCAGRLRGFLERVRLVGGFPAERIFGAAEMAEGRGLAINRAAELQRVDH